MLLGTRLYQHVIKSIRRRLPALKSATNRYNDLCAKLRQLLPPGKTFALPDPIPVQLAQIKDDPSVWEEVWLGEEALDGDNEWLVNAEVRKGIRAQQTVDRCVEEEQRLAREERNVFDWAVSEVSAIEGALHSPSCKSDPCPIT